MRLAPISVKQAIKFCRQTHRRLPELQGAMWATMVINPCVAICSAHPIEFGEVIGVALVGYAARMLGPYTLSVLRCAVREGNPNACTMLYGSCARMAKAQGADDLVTYTHLDEHGASLKAANWIYGGLTRGGEHDRPSRRRKPAVDPNPKHRWWAPWGTRAKEITTARLEEADRRNREV